jgi:superfamily II DNA or RNA helicase
MKLRVTKGFKPRAWAKAAYAAYLNSSKESFLVDACPGAGKTKFAVMLAYNEVARGAVDRVDVVGPSVHICRQWAQEMAAWGLHLDPENDQESSDCIGRVFTYQRLGMSPQSLRTRANPRRLVILDEIHHAGDQKTWGDALRLVYANAERRLLLSGTPFRSDGSPIPFVGYTHGDHGVSTSDFSYGYGDALRDGYCAPLYFPHHDGDFHWERGGETYRFDLMTRLGQQLNADRLRTAYAPEGEFVRELLREAHQHLMVVRGEHPGAAGIVFGRDVENVRALADVLAAVSGTKPVTVTNDDKDAGDKIRRFKDSAAPWLVSVKMVSEGVDIPRLRVGVYLSPVQTEMFFRQAAGRLVRLVPGLEDQAGYLYIPSLPRLVDYAAAMTDERRHAIAKKGPDSGLGGVEELTRGEREEPSDMDYRFLAAVGERAGLVETNTPVNKQGQTFFDFAADLVDDEPEAVPIEEPQLLGELKAGVRRKGGTLSSLVNDLYRTHKVSYAQIHAHLNGLQGVKGQGQCTLEQLDQREDLLRRWLSSGTPPRLQSVTGK